MGVKLCVLTCGSGLLIRIPNEIAEQWGEEEGSLVEIDLQEDRVLLPKQGVDLDALIEEMSPDRRHPETDWGRPEGAEDW